MTINESIIKSPFGAYRWALSIVRPATTLNTDIPQCYCICGSQFLWISIWAFLSARMLLHTHASHLTPKLIPKNAS